MARKMVSFRLHESRLSELKYLAHTKNVSATRLLEALIRSYYKEQRGELHVGQGRKDITISEWADELLGIKLIDE